YLLEHPLRGRPIHLTFGSTGGAGSGTPDDSDRGSLRVFYRWAAARYETLPQGLLLRLHPKAEKVDLAAVLEKNRRLWAATGLPQVGAVRMDQEISPDYVVNHYAAMLVNFGGLYEL